MTIRPLKRDPALAPLSREHHQALLLAFHCKRASAEDAAAQVAATERLWEQGLVPHFRAEEEILAPLLRTHLAHEAESLNRLLRDHVALHALMDQVRAAASVEAQVQALRAFGDLLEQHVRFEERELFPAAQALLTSADRQHLRERLPGALGISCTVAEK